MAGKIDSGRYLGLDYGDKTVGVAVSDPLGVTAQPLETIHREKAAKLRRTFARIEELIVSLGVSKIILGMPYRMDHSEGTRTEKTLSFKEQLERRTGLPVILWDERLTTNAADRILTESGIRPEHRKEYVDEIAAAIILQGFLDRLAFDGAEDGE